MSSKLPKPSLWERLTHRRQTKSSSRTSGLHFEALEERTLLSVTVAEYAALQAEYSVAELPADSSELHLIEVTELTNASLQNALAEAASTVCDDLIVVRTAEGADQIELTEVLTVSLNTADAGTLSLVTLGENSLKLRGSNVVLSVESGDVFLGGVTLVGTENSDCTKSPKELLQTGEGASVEMQSVLFAMEHLPSGTTSSEGNASSGELLGDSSATPAASGSELLVDSGVTPTGSSELAVEADSELAVSSSVLETTDLELSLTGSESEATSLELEETGDTAQETGYYTLEACLGDGQWLYLTGVSRAQAGALEAASYRYVQDDWADADKTNPYIGGTDCNMCWAAQAANMLAYSGWGDAYSTSADTLYHLYTSRFTNSGGDANYALEWFFTGNYSAPRSAGWSQLKSSSSFSGYYTTSDFKSAYSNTTGESSYVTVKQLGTMDSHLRSGYAVGVDVYGYDSSGHAMSVYGFVYDSTYQTSNPNYYTKLVLADSNDGKDALITCSLSWVTGRGVSYYKLDYDGFDDGCYVGAFHYLAPQTTTPTTYTLSSVSLSTNTPQVGVSLTATVTPGSATVAYQWYSGRSTSSMTAISGATSSKFTPTSDLAGLYLKCVATGQGNYAGQSVSAVTGSVVVGSGDVVDEDSSLSATNITRYGSVTVTLYVQNTSNVATACKIQFYASKNANITTSDYELETCTVTVPAQATQKVQQKLTFGDAIPAGTYYIGWMITGTGTGVTGYCETPLTVTLKGNGELATPSLSVTARGTTAMDVTIGSVTGATQYVIQYSAKSFTSSSSSEIQTVRTYSAGTTTIKGLTAGTTYWVRVYAIDADNGRGSQYASTSITTLDLSHSSDLVTRSTGTLASTLILPGSELKISGIQIANIGRSASDEYTISFYATRNANAIGANVSGCILLDTLTLDGLGAGRSTQVTASLSTEGLSSDTAYFLGWVIECTSEVNSSNNTASCASKFMVSSKASQAVLTTTVSGTKVTVSWNAVSKDGTYSVKYRTVGSNMWLERTTKSMSFSINGQADSSYEFVVTVPNPQSIAAVNYSLVMATTVRLPATPRLGKTTATDDTAVIQISNYESSSLKETASQMTVAITKVGNTAVDCKAVLKLANGSGTGTFTGCDVTAAFENGLLTLSGLNSNTNYNVEVAFECPQSNGGCIASSAAKATLRTTKTAFVNVENVTVTARSESTLTVTWDKAAAKDNDALLADYYTVQYRVAGTEHWMNAGTRIAYSETGYTLQWLKADTNYEVRVLATATTQYNASNDGEIAAAQTLIKLETPRLMRDTVLDDTITVKVANYANLQRANQLTVTLTLVGNTKTNVTAVLTLADGCSTEPVALAETGISCSFADGVLTLGGLKSSTAYAVKVGFSTVSTGEKTAVSADSTEFRVMTSKTTYTTPQDLQATAVSSTSVQLTWSASVGKNTTKQAQYYSVQYFKYGHWQTAMARVSGTSCTLNRLMAGTYQIRVCAVGTSEFNASGYSEPVTVTVG